MKGKGVGRGRAIDGFYSLIELDKQTFIAHHNVVDTVDGRLEARDLLYLS
jgi:hypothetical protein